LGLFDTTMIVVGAIIGAGIFTITGFVADRVPSAWLIIAVWMAGGLLSLAGALTLGELGTAMPDAGGDYIYLRETYGPLWGFLTGWVSFFVTFSGSIAALGIALVGYLSFFFPSLSLAPQQAIYARPITPDYTFSLSYGHLVAIAAVLWLSAINYCGVKIGSRFQDFLSLLKIGTMLLLVVFGFTIGRGAWMNFSATAPFSRTTDLIRACGLALIPILFAYNGWNAAIYIGGEIKRPARNLPLSLFLGTLISTAIYLLINLVYLYALPVDKMKNVVRIGELAASSLFGPAAAGYIVIAIVVSMLGCMNAMILTGARIYYAMARDGLFFHRAARIHPRFGTPSSSLVLQAICSSLLVISGTLDQLYTYVAFAIVLFSAITGAAVFVLRKKRPGLKRPYKTWGYPVVPALFVLSCLWLMINTLVERPRESLAGLGIVLLGVPAYWYWKSNVKRET
jgi:APA family basic amino acid/polyamine antiporter